MSRKLDVAIGLMHRPRVLFLDEPTTGLDPEARAEMWAEIGRLSADEQVTVLLTTHYLDEADQLADRLAIVDHGRVVVEGTPEELKSELRGDTVHVELALPETVAGRGWADVSARGVARTVGRSGEPSGAGGQRRASRASDPRGSRRESHRGRIGDRRRPSLDDVYLRYAGRSFEAAA